MSRKLSSVAAFGTALLVGAVALGIGSPAQAAPEPDPAGLAAAALTTEPCDPDGTTAADAALADKLNGQLDADMRGNMNAYRTSCARVVIEAVKARGLQSRAAVIAIATVIVESHLQNRSDVVDHTSVGLFQQLDSWGSTAQRLDPVWATNAFLNKMLRVYPNDSWVTKPIGEVCQGVQVSAFPEKYQVQAADAQIIVNALWNGAGGARNDFDGDGASDIGLYRAAGGTWHIKSTKRNVQLYGGHQYGGNGSDIPLVGDFDNDGYADIALYRKSEGTWHVKSVKRNVQLYGGHEYGGNGSDIPLVGDFDGDGYDDIALYRASEGTWHVKSLKRNVQLYGGHEYGGNGSDIPLVGDFDGDGYADIALYRASEGTWHVKSLKRNVQIVGSHPYGGNSSDKPVVGDFDGDGADDIGLYRAVGGTWHLKSIKRNVQLYGGHEYGGNGTDIPQVGDFDGDGTDDIGLYRAGEGTWHLKSLKRNVQLVGSHPYGGNSSDVPINR